MQDPNQAPVHSPNQTREQKLAVLRNSGYSSDRCAALEGAAPLPEVPNDLSESVPYVNCESGWLDPKETLESAQPVVAFGSQALERANEVHP